MMCDPEDREDPPPSRVNGVPTLSLDPLHVRAIEFGRLHEAVLSVRDASRALLGIAFTPPARAPRTCSQPTIPKHLSTPPPHSSTRQAVAPQLPRARTAPTQLTTKRSAWTRPRSALAASTSERNSADAARRFTSSGRTASMTDVSHSPEYEPGVGPRSPVGAHARMPSADRFRTAASSAELFPPCVDTSATTANPVLARPSDSSNATAVSVSALTLIVPGRFICALESPTRTVGASTASNRPATSALSASATSASAPSGKWPP